MNKILLFLSLTVSFLDVNANVYTDSFISNTVYSVNYTKNVNSVSPVGEIINMSSKKDIAPIIVLNNWF